MTMFARVLMGATFTLGWLVGGAAPRAAERPCRDEVQKFCKDKKPGKGEIVACLEEHLVEASRGCQDYLAQRRRDIAEAHRVCGADAARLCKEEKTGVRIAACLKQHESELAAACKAIVAKLPSPPPEQVTPGTAAPLRVPN